MAGTAVLHWLPEVFVEMRLSEALFVDPSRNNYCLLRAWLL